MPGGAVAEAAGLWVYTCVFTAGSGVSRLQLAGGVLVALPNSWALCGLWCDLF